METIHDVRFALASGRQGIGIAQLSGSVWAKTKSVLAGLTSYNGIMSTPDSPDASRHKQFASTHWSLVLEAGRENSPTSQQALATLCETYWYPLYAFVRRHGYAESDAQDLTQGFFLRLLDKRDFAALDREKGRFRSFLLASLKHFLINEWDKARAVKRGGGQPRLSLEFISRINPISFRTTCFAETSLGQLPFQFHVIQVVAMLDKYRPNLR